MLVPREVLNKVGLMADVYFLYYEEHDWAARIKRAGYKIYYDGRSLVRHKESISTVKDSPFQIFYMHRGRVLYARRNSKGLSKVISMIYLYSIALTRIIFGFLLRKRLDLVKAYLKAMWWNLTNFKGIHEAPELK